MDQKHENPPPYSEAQGPPPPPGFVQTQQPYPYPTQPQSSYPYPNQQTYSNPYPPSYSNPTVINVVPTNQTRHQVLVVGGCPSCRVGVLDERPTCAGICCCILFFPIGLICLFTMRQKVCINCGAQFH
ncbi:brain protein I3-like [Daphnia pulicaria]|uniref:brain protein I3-like n=1 Tax=Daphnia pulicaria TaxID=35523 RepID=UPI001EEAB2DB|nr:brain protein I3-like [Daphnia pulicaria]